jgi:hypothetical protein
MSNHKAGAAVAAWFAAPARSTPALVKLDRRIVPDEKWPDMYRLKRPDGSLSDMANLARIKDALRTLNERRHD